MREIKFRGKRRDNGEWIKGSCVCALNSTLIIPHGYRYAEQFAQEVDHKTVGQFTGCHDKNFIEIYEGDIVRLYVEAPYNAVREIEGEVVWERGCLTVQHDKQCAGWWLRDDGKDMLVLGNIYDKKETQNG